MGKKKIDNNKLSNVKKVLNTDYNTYTLKKSEVFDTNVKFEKYIKPFLNFTNQMANATKPKVVGQMTTIIPTYIQESIDQNKEISPTTWKDWYTSKPEYKDNRDNAKSKIMNMLEQLKEAVNSITEAEVDKWIDNFLFTENIRGVAIQERIKNLIQAIVPTETKVRSANSKEESKNIDILVDEKPYQVKPLTPKTGTAFNQKWGDEDGIWYKERTKGGNGYYDVFIPKDVVKKG